MTVTDPESKRVQEEYQKRNQNSVFNALYAPYSPFNIYHQARLELLIGKGLATLGMLSLKDCHIFDVGCGSGGHLLQFLMKDALPQNLHGIDIIPERIQAAKTLHPEITFHLGNATTLPYPPEYFDLVTQFTVFSSILDATLQRQIADEMVRVLKPNGAIIWFDAKAQNSDPALTAFSEQQVKALFPALTAVYHAPAKLRFGLSRRLISVSWELVSFLERFPFLCEMEFMVLKKP